MRWIIAMGLVIVLMACQPKVLPELVQSQEIALANPIVKIDSILFNHRATITILATHENAIIRYTTDGSAVTETSPICPNPLILNENADIKCKAFHQAFKPSEGIGFSIRKITTDIKPQIVAISTKAKEPYKGKGLAALSNGEKGQLNFRTNQEWLGYQKEIIELHLLFEESTYCKQIILSTLCDHDSWIFTPSKIEVIQKDKVIASHRIDRSQVSEVASLQFLDISLATELRAVILKIYMDQIPEWHIGKGTVPWFFIDEIIVQ